MTTINRKRDRLVEKLKGLQGNLLVVHPAYKGIIDDTVQLEVSRETLIELLTSDRVLSDPQIAALQNLFTRST